MRTPEIQHAIRGQLAGVLQQLGFDDFDNTGSNRQQRALTQTVARWAFEQGFTGIVYKSRFGDQFDCWAIFEGARFASLGHPEPILPEDPDLAETIELIGLIR